MKLDLTPIQVTVLNQQHQINALKEIVDRLVLKIEKLEEDNRKLRADINIGELYLD